MLNRKAIALNVDNLTDARYFAALGVSHITFPYDPNIVLTQSVARYKEIMEWCEGISFLIRYDSEDHYDAILAIMDELPIDGVVRSVGVDKEVEAVEEFVMVKDANGYQSKNESLLLMSCTESEVDRLAGENQVFVALTEQTRSMLDAKEDVGLVLFGSAEEKVGYKSYEELNDLIDRMSAI